MAGKKYYAVKKGKTPGVYHTWEACRSQVEGVPGAVYKGFASLEEAEVFAGLRSGQNPISEVEKEKPGEARAYVDGSYNEETGEYSCGVVLFVDGEELHFCQKGEDEDMASMRNVAGEIMGAQLAMKEALERGMKKLVIYHDYQGISSWCLGEWKANKNGTKAYKQFFDSVKNKIEIEFIKVKGHSGDTYNDLADELAKSVVF